MLCSARNHKEQGEISIKLTHQQALIVISWASALLRAATQTRQGLAWRDLSMQT